MRKSNIFALSSAVLLLAAVSCTSEKFLERGDSVISLKLASKSLETKATELGEDPFNENVINSVYYFFYKDGEDTSAPVVKGDLSGLDHRSGVRTEDIPVPSGTAAVLFESSDECRAFIVANPPQDLESFLEGSPTLGQLRTKLFQSSLDGIQDSFTMVFDDKAVKAAASGKILIVEANLRRLANKFTISLNINDRTSAETEWKSVPSDAEVEFHNAFKETSLGGDFAAVKTGDSDYKKQYFNTAPIAFGDPVKEDGKWKCRTERPVYTYSMTWDFAGGTEPYLVIGLPWKNISSGETQTTWYKVLFNNKELTTNNWCHLNVELDRLGSFFKEDPVQVFSEEDYLVLDWNDAFDDVDGPVADIDDARYLMMNQTEYWLYSQETWNFPYTSSHDCMIILESYEKMNYRKRNAEVISGNSRELVDGDGNTTYGCTLDGSLITFFHKLNSDFDSTEDIEGVKYGTYDVVPYTFKFVICHKDKPLEYRQEVIVHQYPAIYIEAQPNSAGVKLEPGTGQQSTSFVNINPLLVADGIPEFTDKDGNPIGLTSPGDTVHFHQYYGYGSDPCENGSGSMTIGNSNGNMYVITTATPPVIDGVECMLADPRRLTSNVAELRKDCNETGELISEGYMTMIYHPSGFGDLAYPLAEEDNDIFEEAPALYGDSPRTLTWYYPTKSTKEAENIIAPKLRVASSWGQTHMLSYDKALRRCAAYQEDGYPAGRWRVPTKAEVMYICKLSSDHVIPQLFGQFNANPEEAKYYWCSTGKVGVYKVEEADGTLLDRFAPPVYSFETEHEFEADKSISVRCVYDEWYWENRDGGNGVVNTTKGRLPEGHWNERYWGDMPR